MRIDWIRHGETKGNREHRYVGRTDEPLTEEAVRFCAQCRFPQPQLVFASPLLRCRQTAQLLYPERTPVIVEAFSEIRFGRFEYKNAGELSGDPGYQAWIDSGGTLPFPGGESREEYIRRTCAGVQEALRRAQEERAEHIALVVHGGTIMAALSVLAEPMGDYFAWQCGNLGGFVTDYDGNRIKIISKIVPKARKAK